MALFPNTFSKIRDSFRIPLNRSNNILYVSPGSSWNGTAGSGYGGNPPIKSGIQVNTRPSLSWLNGTIAPAAHFVNLDNDPMMNDDFEIQVSTFAASSEGIFGGVSLVKFYVEGNSYTLTQPLIRDIRTRIGASTYTNRKAEVWPIILKYSDFTTSGAVDIYAEITPSLPGVASRVIGPLRVFRKPTYDRVIDIAPSQTVITGSRYQSVQTALTFLNTSGVSGEHVLLRCIEDFIIDPGSVAFTGSRTNTNSRRGQVVVDANGFNVTLRRTSSFDLFRPSYNGLVFQGIKIDVANISQVYNELGTGTDTGWRTMQFVDCEIYSSNGKGELPGIAGQGQGIAKSNRGASIFSTPLSAVRCWMHDYDGNNMTIQHMVGNLVEDISGDFCQVYGNANGSSTYYTALILNNTVRRIDGQIFQNPRDSIRLSYTGIGSATIDITGTHQASSRALVLKVDGTIVRTITASVTIGSGIFSMQDAVNDININLSSSGWSAELLNDTLRFAAVGFPTNTYVYQGITNISITSSGTVLSAGLDIHADGIQLQGQNFFDNVIFYGNYMTDMVTQMLFASVQNSARSAYNCWYINNAGKMIANYPLRSSVFSQWAGTHRHCGMIHNSFPDQALTFRRDLQIDMDSTCRVYGNIFESISTSGTNNPFDVQIKYNLALNNLSITSNNSSNNTVSATAIQNYPNVNTVGFTENDFIPTIGQSVRLFLIPKQVSVDIAGNIRPSLSISGAISV